MNLFETKMDRRRLLNNMVMVGAGATLAACTPRMKDVPLNLDPAILNFALNLEYLEAAFYLAAVGQLDKLPGYAPDKVLLPNGFDGLTALPFVQDADNVVGQYATEIALDELAHVQFLRSALGMDAAELPTVDLSGSFQAAASAAFGLVADPGSLGLPASFTPADFNPLDPGNPLVEALFLHGAFIFEDVGVTAYKGAARYIKNKDFLRAAAGILAVEGYHAGEVRIFLYAADKRVTDRYGGLDTWTITAAISAARDSLDGDSNLDQGIVKADRFGLTPQAHGGANIVPTDENSIVFSRTPRQVANIVLLNPDPMNATGGFFPNGLNIPAGLEDEFAVLLDPEFPNNLP
ncbi:ferritin-like domain-containing protein [soil metagenome]